MLPNTADPSAVMFLSSGPHWLTKDENWINLICACCNIKVFSFTVKESFQWEKWSLE
jgi:hypothetical protein